ncbi:MAG: glutathione S-transferase N-terminal domain-containing protein [Rhodoplanes sp.]|uniref:glutathione S-transferase family protein n=1 Tax=Rhodoplanes sp. TaxID=1968906 RepID=UPI0018287CC0|nr:glutathione binding-like protein [Rhodoplanes sp.]NVO17240.1 glutathione S-transferase N-terminal domain-containing protein [Rhodoplanes sp.]
MIDLYALTSPNVQKVFIALEELALPYDTILVDVWKGEQFREEFARLNPNRKIPVIVDHDGPGGKPVTVFESGAILIYLAEKTGRLLPADPLARLEVLQWLMLQMSTLGPMSGQHVHFSKFAPPGNDYGASRFRTEVNRLFDLYDGRLASRDWVAGDDYSIADIAAFPWLRNHGFLGISVEGRPNLTRWVERIAARPAVQRAMAKVATIPSSRDTASEDDRDRIFQRGRWARG